MDPLKVKQGDRIQHPDFGEGEVVNPGTEETGVFILWDRQGEDSWPYDDHRWAQVERAY